MRLVGLVLACLVAPACGAAESTPPRVEEQAEGRAATTDGDRLTRTRWRNEDRGFTVSYPVTWRRAESPLTPHLSDPVEVLALGTYELRAGGDRCAHQPVNAVEDLGARDALIVVFERAPPFSEFAYPPRPGQPELQSGTGRFCVPVTDRLDSWFSFGERGRAFYVLMALGEDASEETRRQLHEVYESLAFDER